MCVKVRSQHGAGVVIQLFPVQTSFNPAQRKLSRKNKREAQLLQRFGGKKWGTDFAIQVRRRLLLLLLFFKEKE